jgi:hypothetical protein
MFLYSHATITAVELQQETNVTETNLKKTHECLTRMPEKECLKQAQMMSEGRM